MSTAAQEVGNSFTVEQAAYRISDNLLYAS